jgi:two-component system, NtrC family, C4-dicarboxylate transport response regulator DctD
MPEPCQVLFVDDELPVRMAVLQWLELAGMTVTALGDALEALRLTGPDFPGIVVSDVRMPGLGGFELLDRVLEMDRYLPVVLVTGHGDIAMAVEAMRRGAYDFIEKPFVPERLVDTIRRAFEKRQLVLENRRLRSGSGAAGIEARLMGTSPAMERLRREVLELAGTAINVVIRGETGTGKELVARCLHDFGPRGRRPFVAVNCGAIPETMFESEFFGHEAGAFTGAAGRRIGRLEYAHGGTVFLDEIESMPASLQVKVLRALQERTIERLGSHQSITVDLRVVAAAKLDLLEAVHAGSFREDLYYRLNVAEIHIPPLRQRGQDIVLLFEFFASEAARLHGREPRPLGAADAGRLLAHGWPGNVRELKNAAERFALGLSGLSLPGSVPAAPPPAGLSLAAVVADFERRTIEAAMAACQGDVSRVMAMLELPRRTLNEKMVRYSIDRNRFVAR